MPVPLNGFDREEHDGSVHGKNISIVKSTVTLFSVVNTVGGGNVTLDPGSFTGIRGNLTIDSGTITSITNPIALKGNITLDVGSLIGLRGNVTISDSKSFIGLVSVGGGILNTITALTDITNPIALKGNLTLSDSKGFLGLVTAWNRNAGTTKTLIPIPIALSTSSQATVAVPATNQSIYITSLVMSSDATVRVSVKSGVTYLTGNASIGITLNPGGGWVQTGAPDAPVYISTASASINIEKFDMTGTKANLGGSITYFTE